MDTLKLGLAGLSLAEEALVATLFRLHRVDPSFIWALPPEGPFDALLVDVGCDERAYARWAGRKVHVMRLGRLGGEAVDGVLQRPIRSDLLVRWLNSIEVDVLHGGQDAFASTVCGAYTETRPPSAFNSIFSDVPTFNAPEREDPLRAFKFGACSFKLRRWPTPDLLRGDVHRIRMATMLSRRHLKLNELCALSRLSEVKCEEFVKELYTSRFLDEGVSIASVVRATPWPSAPVPTVHDVVPEPSAQVPGARVEPKARGLGASLIASIRKRFGIL